MSNNPVEIVADDAAERWEIVRARLKRLQVQLGNRAAWEDLERTVWAIETAIDEACCHWQFRDLIVDFLHDVFLPNRTNRRTTDSLILGIGWLEAIVTKAEQQQTEANHAD